MYMYIRKSKKCVSIVKGLKKYLKNEQRTCLFINTIFPEKFLLISGIEKYLKSARIHLIIVKNSLKIFNNMFEMRDSRKKITTNK